MTDSNATLFPCPWCGKQPTNDQYASGGTVKGHEHWNTRATLGAGECATCTERQGYYLDAETIRNQQEHIAELEKLVRDMFADDKCFRNKRGWYRKRMKELGIEVES